MLHIIVSNFSFSCLIDGSNISHSPPPPHIILRSSCEPVSRSWLKYRRNINSSNSYSIHYATILRKINNVYVEGLELHDTARDRVIHLRKKDLSESLRKVSWEGRVEVGGVYILMIMVARHYGYFWPLFQFAFDYMQGHALDLWRQWSPLEPQTHPLCCPLPSFPIFIKF